MYIRRHMEHAVKERAKEKGAVVVTGQRQVGKTTLIENLKPDIARVTLDDMESRYSARNEPNAFLELNPPPIFIDEVQYAPEIFSSIKMILDKSKKKGEFYLTGSQKFHLMKNVSESLAGRAGILELMGLSLREMREEEWNRPFLPTMDYLLARKNHKKELGIKKTWDIIHRGGMPELAANKKMNWNNYYADYILTYIERDVRKLTQVADEMDFKKFITVCAAKTGQILNMASLARDVGISESTAKRWLSILQTSGIVYLLQPYSANTIKKAVKTPKLHFLDTGLGAYLTKWLTPETLSTGAMSGHFFETFVVAEILKSYKNAGKDAELYYLRDGNKTEIDLLIFSDNTLYPIEIKQKSNPRSSDIGGFSMTNRIKGVKIGEGGVICMAKDILPLNDRNRIIPIWAM